ncbi:MAG: vWA domain-containing protein [bacterium]
MDLDQPLIFRLPRRLRVTYNARMRILAVLLLFVSTTVFAQETRPPVHVEIVLDSSGSMLDNDPTRLSSLAGMIFADLADPADLVGVQCMQKKGYTLQPLAPVSKAQKTARERIKSLPFLGTTDCAGPLKVAADELKKAKSPDARQFVIFLSDGVCPRDRPDEAQALLDAAEQLRNDGVRVFSLGLFDESATEGQDPERDLQMLSAATNGEYFRATKAADLPRRFSDILGRILGSEAQPFAINPGKATTVELDGYVADASVIVTSTSRSVRATRVVNPLGEVLAIPIKTPPFDERGANFYVSAGTNGKSSHYVVLRLIKPESGAWSFIVDAPADAEAIVIQNYALIPKLQSPAGTKSGEPVELKMTLSGPDGSTINDAKFLAKVIAGLTP